MDKVEVELKVCYFNSLDCHGVEYTRTYKFDTYEEAKQEAPKLVEEAERRAEDDCAMPGTFYYEYDYLIPERVYQRLGL